MVSKEEKEKEDQNYTHTFIVDLELDWDIVLFIDVQIQNYFPHQSKKYIGKTSSKNYFDLKQICSKELCD